MTGRRVALVPGGGRGLGRAVALDLAGSGWDLTLGFHVGDDAAEATAEEARAAGARVVVARCDVADPVAARALVEGAGRDHGRLDALVVAAGLYHRVPLLEERPEAWARAFAVNVHGLLHLALPAAPLMAAGGWGRIVAFGVAGAETPRAFGHVAAHHASKLALAALARSLARELAPKGVTVNVVSPGFVDSGGLPPPELDRFRRLVPSGEAGAPADVVAAVRFLLSDGASYVTGATIPVAGGYGL